MANSQTSESRSDYEDSHRISSKNALHWHISLHPVKPSPFLPFIPCTANCKAEKQIQQMGNNKHTHNKVSPLILRLAEGEIFTCKTHSELDLANYITSQVKVRNKPKQIVLNEFWSYDVRSPYTPKQFRDFTPEEDILQLYFKMFDTIFFFGSLQDRCKVYMQMNNNGGPFDGISSIQAQNPLTGSIHSGIIIHELKIKNREKLLQVYLSVLLHEMITTFLFTYACGSGDGCPDRKLNVCYNAAWQDIAYALEKGAKDLLGLELSLFRKWTIVVELCRDGGEALESMESWGFDDKSLRELAGDMKETVRGDMLRGVGVMDWLISQEFGSEIAL